MALSKVGGNQIDTVSDGLTVDDDGATVLTVDRATDNGAIIDIQKDGTSVGSVQSRGGAVTSVIFDPRSNGAGMTGTTNAIMPTNQSGAIGDGTAVVDLGASGYRFRNMFLSGNLYIGGTGSANGLSDYEEGTWTPAIYYQNTDDQTNSNNDTQTGFYVKVGTLVTAVCYLKWDATNSRANDNIGVTNLPFIGSQVSGNNEVRYIAPVSYSATSYPQGDSQVLAVTNPGNNLVSFITANGTANLGDEFGQNNNMEVRFTLHYVTN